MRCSDCIFFYFFFFLFSSSALLLSKVLKMMNYWETRNLNKNSHILVIFNCFCRLSRCWYRRLNYPVFIFCPSKLAMIFAKFTRIFFCFTFRGSSPLLNKRFFSVTYIFIWIDLSSHSLFYNFINGKTHLNLLIFGFRSKKY